MYLSVAHQIGSAQALELAQELSSWHDQMVMHARAVARDGARHFTFLKASATQARAAEDIVDAVGSEVPPGSPDDEGGGKTAHAKSAGRR